MAKTCSRCGSVLPLRRFFVLQGSSLCDACLNRASDGVLPAVSASGELRGVDGWLLLFVIGCFIAAILNLVLGLVTMPGIITNRPYSFSVGVLSIVTGAVLLTSRNSSAISVARSYLAVVLVGTLIVAIVGVEPPPGQSLRGGDTALWRSVAQAILLNLIWQPYFVRSKRVRATYPGAAPSLNEFLAIRRYSSLFDRQRNGVNYYVGAGLLLALLLPAFLASMTERGVTRLPLTEVAFAFLTAAVFLIASHLIRNQWLLPVFFGLMTALLDIGRRVLVNATHAEIVDPEPVLSVGSIVLGFWWGLWFMVGLIAAVRLWGPKWWSLSLGMVLLALMSVVGRQLFRMLTMERVSFDPFDIAITALIAVVRVVLVGALMYAGLVLHLKSRGAQMQPPVTSPARE